MYKKKSRFAWTFLSLCIIGIASITFSESTVIAAPDVSEIENRIDNELVNDHQAIVFKDKKITEQEKAKQKKESLKKYAAYIAVGCIFISGVAWFSYRLGQSTKNLSNNLQNNNNNDDSNDQKICAKCAENSLKANAALSGPLQKPDFPSGKDDIEKKILEHVNQTYWHRGVYSDTGFYFEQLPRRERVKSLLSQYDAYKKDQKLIEDEEKWAKLRKIHDLYEEDAARFERYVKNAKPGIANEIRSYGRKHPEARDRLYALIRVPEPQS
jgi:hypothetical protein